MDSTLEADYAFIRDPSRRRLALHAFKPQQPLPAGERLPAAAPAAPLAQTQRIRFWDFPSSPFCIKLRAIMRWKGLRFEALDPLRPRHWLELQRRGTGKVPALDIAGEFVTDSTDIACRLDALFPERPVLPAHPRAAALSHAIEEWADESLYFVGLHYLWLHPRSRHMVPPLFGSNLIGRITYPAYRWLIRRQVRGQGTGRKSPARIEADLLRHLVHADALLADGPFVLGHTPCLADFALFGQLAFLLRARASRDFVQAHPRLMVYVERMRALARPGDAA